MLTSRASDFLVHMKWNDYFESAVMSAARNHSSLCCARQSFSREFVLHFNKCTFLPCLTEYCCVIPVWSACCVSRDY